MFSPDLIGVGFAGKERAGNEDERKRAAVRLNLRAMAKKASSSGSLSGDHVIALRTLHGRSGPSVRHIVRSREERTRVPQKPDLASATIGLFYSSPVEEALVRCVLADIGGVSLLGRVQIIQAFVVRGVAGDFMLISRTLLAAVRNRNFRHVFGHEALHLKSTPAANKVAVAGGGRRPPEFELNPGGWWIVARCLC